MNLRLYYDHFPVFIPFGLYSIFSIQRKGNEIKYCSSWDYYYYKVEGSNFYLLDLSLIKLFAFDFDLIRKKFDFGKLKGEICFLSEKEVKEKDLALKENYNRAFILVEDILGRYFSAIVYFVINKDKIIRILEEN